MFRGDHDLKAPVGLRVAAKGHCLISAPVGLRVAAKGHRLIGVPVGLRLVSKAQFNLFVLIC